MPALDVFAIENLKVCASTRTAAGGQAGQASGSRFTIYDTFFAKKVGCLSVGFAHFVEHHILICIPEYILLNRVR